MTIRTFIAGAAMALAATMAVAPAGAAVLFDYRFTAPLTNGDTASGSGTLTADDADAQGHYRITGATGTILGYDGDPDPKTVLGVDDGAGGDAVLFETAGAIVSDSIAFLSDSVFLSPVFQRTNGAYDGRLGEVGIRGAAIDIVRQTGAVPEAATWAMLLTGTALTGGALRRRTAEARARA